MTNTQKIVIAFAAWSFLMLGIGGTVVWQYKAARTVTVVKTDTVTVTRVVHDTVHVHDQLPAMVKRVYVDRVVRDTVRIQDSVKVAEVSVSDSVLTASIKYYYEPISQFDFKYQLNPRTEKTVYVTTTQTIYVKPSFWEQAGLVGLGFAGGYLTAQIPIRK